MTNQTSHQAIQAPADIQAPIAAQAANRAAPAVLALLFGAFLVFGTGFAQSDTLHNAAHDTRHAFAFPCH